MGTNFIDKYSLLHFASGIVAYFFNISITQWIIINILFETLENTKEGIEIINNFFIYIWPGGKNYPDTFVNIIGDITFSILGWLVASILDYYDKKLKLHK
jgi:hypothetical protein